MGKRPSKDPVVTGDPRLAEIEFLSSLEQNGATNYAPEPNDKSIRNGLPAVVFRERVFERLRHGCLNDSATLFRSPRSHIVSVGLPALMENIPLQGMADILEWKSVSLELSYKGRLYLYRLRDEMLTNHNREHFGILWDRRAWDLALRVRLPMASPSSPVTVMMCDVDRFKQINDTKGHPIGDKVLQSVFRLIRDTTNDHAYRYGGEEIGVVVPGLDFDEAKKQAETICAVIRREVFAEVPDAGREVTISIGVSTYTAVLDREQAVTYVDELLYEAKNAGRDRVIARLRSSRSASP